MLKYILCGIILVILYKMLLNVLNNLSYNIKKATREASEKNKYNKKIAEEKRIKEKWINDLRSGKTVNIGTLTMQCKNNIFIIGEKKFSVKEIQRVDFTYDIVGVKKHKKIYDTDYHYEISMTYNEFLNKTKEYPEPQDVFIYYEFTNAYYILIILNNGKEEQYLLGSSNDQFGKTLEDYSVQKYMVLELGKYINELKVKASTIYL